MSDDRPESELSEEEQLGRPEGFDLSPDGTIYDGESDEAFAPQFAVDTMEKAEWALSLMMQEQSQIDAIKGRKAAIAANLDAMEKARARRLEFLHRRFDADLERFATAELAGKKAKSLQTAFGKIGMRSLPGRIVVKDDALALLWLGALYPQAVRTRKEIDRNALKAIVDLPEELFEVIPAGERFFVSVKGGEAE